MNNKTVYLFLSLLMLASFATRAQLKITNHEQQSWVAYLNQTRLSKHWGLWFDGHLRTRRDHFTNFSTSILRLGLTYYVTDQGRFTAGYAHVNHFPAAGHPNNSRTEHRPWQQFLWLSNYSNLRLSQYIRLEERFRQKISNNTLVDGYDYTSRVRYTIVATLPLSKRKFKPGGWCLVANEELHINLGNKNVYNTFDQNRFFLGIQYAFTGTTALQLGYLHHYTQLSAGNVYQANHVVRINFIQNLDLRR